jgi:diguanylate cyclase (GGDEF)-like protein/PAS domain S-box-containing protein
MTDARAPCILLVEDNPADARLVERLLGRVWPTGLQVSRSASVREALERLRHRSFDVVLLDLTLPDTGVDELGSFRRLRALASELPIVVLTGLDREELALQAIAEGAEDYLLKRELEPGLLGRSLRYAMARNRAERALRESEERYCLAVRGANDGLWDWDLVRGRIYLAPRWKSMIGYRDEEVGDAPQEWLERVHPEDSERLAAELQRHLEGQCGHFESEHRIRHRDGRFLWVLSRGLAVRDRDGRPTRIAGSLTDVTRRRQTEEQLQHDALHDALTGLPNRALLRDRLCVALAHRSRRRDYLFALLFLDLDRFKTVNDSLGHLVGDELLVSLARRLQGLLRPGDTVARLGGDEFALIADDITEARDATRLAERIHQALCQPFHVASHELFTSASIGIAVGADGYREPDEILRDADIAMYRAKLDGVGRHQLFDPAMHQRAVAQLRLETDLKRALERDELRVHYQPIVALGSGELEGFEALLRWLHPERGVVMPDDFIPVAEETGLILEIGRWALEEACRQMADWHRTVPAAGHVALAVNLSPRQFRQADLVPTVREVLAKTGLEPTLLRLEITESMIMSGAEVAIPRLMELRALGVQIHIDDFGTGYSSLSYLHSLPTDTLKIDRSFVRQMVPESQGAAIVSTIVALARRLGMHVAAEGIETAEQMAAFRELSCEYGQGFFFSRALEPAAAALLLREPRHWC